MNKKIITISGWIVLALGIIGFFSNPLVSDHGFFLTDKMHNVVRIIAGGVMLWVGYSLPMKIGATLKVFSIIYLLAAILGFVSGSGYVLGMASNTADNWLHLIFALVFVWYGFMGKSEVPMTQPM